MMTSVESLNPPHNDKVAEFNNEFNNKPDNKFRMEHRPSPRKDAGFSLLEIMVALVIIGLLTATVVINVVPNIGTAQTTRAKSDIRSLTTALELYRLDLFDYPDEQDGLRALVEAPAGLSAPERYRLGGYLQGGLPNDPWNRPYIYRYPGENGVFDIISYGADGEIGGEGNDADIVSWEK